MMDRKDGQRAEDSLSTLRLSPITTISTPTTVPSTPTSTCTLPSHEATIDDLEQSRFIPPERPQSTPFPQPDLMEGDIVSSGRTCDTERPPDRLDLPPRTQDRASNQPQGLTLCTLPTEIQERILDYLSGTRASATARSAGAGNVLKGWGTALRHSRRKEVSDLSLVSASWRELIQERLYRHLKIKATQDSVYQAQEWFISHPDLCGHVKHIEFWFPVFQQKNPAFDRTLQTMVIHPRSEQQPGPPASSDAVDILNGQTLMAYQSPSNNCTLEDVFHFVQFTFANVNILTLEGGDRKKPPMVQQFRFPDTQFLPKLNSVRTLVCKGQWNLIRSNDDFQHIAAALPALEEWHGSYSKPKSKSYISMATILPKLPLTLKHLNLCLEADYRKEVICPVFFKKVGLATHFCQEMSKALPTLERLQYTGRICHCLFDNAAKLSNPRTTKLKSIDIVVKNVCRPTYLWSDGSGVTDMAFILAFESLVLSAVKSLKRLQELTFLRIRFIDLEAAMPSLNPYFQLEDNKCTGIWSDTIIEALEQARPTAAFIEKSETIDAVVPKDGTTPTPLGTVPTGTGTGTSRTRPLSIKVSSYMALSGNGITIT